MEDAAAAVAGDVTEIKRKVDEVLAQEKLTQTKMKELSRQQEHLAAEAKRIQAGVAAMFDRIGATQAGIDQLKQDVASLKRDVLSQLQVLTTIVTAIASDVRVILGYVVSAEVRRLQQLELLNLVMRMEDLVAGLRDRIPLHVVASELLHVLKARDITKYSFDEVPGREAFVRITAILQRHRDSLTQAERDELAAYRTSLQRRERASDLLRTLLEAERALITSQTTLTHQIDTVLTRAADLRANAMTYRAAAQLRARSQAHWSVGLTIIAVIIICVGWFTSAGRDVSYLAVLPAIGAFIAFLMSRSSSRYSPEQEASALEQRAESSRAQLSAASGTYGQTLTSISASAVSLGSINHGGLSAEELRKALQSTKVENDRFCSGFMKRHPEMRFAA